MEEMAARGEFIGSPENEAELLKLGAVKLTTLSHADLVNQTYESIYLV
jgi:hypothetical protein